MTEPKIDPPIEKIDRFCQKWNVIELALFGSVLREDFREDSDVDIMVRFHPDTRPTFLTLEQMETELQTIFGREVDVVTRQGIEASRNYLRRNEILSSSRVIYESGSTISA